MMPFNNYEVVGRWLVDIIISVQSANASIIDCRCSWHLLRLISAILTIYLFINILITVVIIIMSHLVSIPIIILIICTITHINSIIIIIIIIIIIVGVSCLRLCASVWVIIFGDISCLNVNGNSNPVIQLWKIVVQLSAAHSCLFLSLIQVRWLL